MDTLTSMKVFHQVVESGGFARAAERLDISTAAVSKHVAYTEKRLGVRLLNRNNRRLSLTEPGRIYLERARSILKDLEAAELELGSLQRLPQGTLRITAPSFATWPQLADLLAQYHARHPKVLVDLSLEDRFVDVVEEGYDVALRIASCPGAMPGHVVARAIRPVAFYLAASREYLTRRGAPKSPADLAQHDLIAAGSLLNCLSSAGLKELREVPDKAVLRYRSMDGVARAVVAGIGIAPVPALLFEDLTFKDVLIPIFPERPLLQATMYVVYASRKFVPLKVRSFVDFVVESISGFSEPKSVVVRASNSGHSTDTRSRALRSLESSAALGSPCRS